MIERIGRGGFGERELFAVRVESTGARVDPPPGHVHFAMLIAADASSDPAGFDAFLSHCMARGASWIATWGPGTDRAFEVIYDVHGRGGHPAWHVTASWHEGHPLSHAVEAFLWASAPDECTFDACTAGLLVTVGDVVAPHVLRDAVLAECRSDEDCSGR